MSASLPDKLRALAKEKQVSTEWKPIPGYPRYQISNVGQIKSAGKHLNKSNLLRPQTNQKGYYRICLYNDSGKKYWTVHSLVLTAFVGPRPTPEHDASHLNDIKTDNRLENLKWSTKSENSKLAVINRRRKLGSQHPNAKLSNEAVNYIRRNYRGGMRKSNAKELANKFGISCGSISRIVSGQLYKTVPHE